MDKPDKAKKQMDSVTFIKEKSEEGTLWAILRQVHINRSFYNGYQYISYDKVQRRVYVPDLRPGERRYVFNKIKPAVKTLLAKTCKNRIKLEVKPDTNDVERIEIAKASLKMLHYQWDTDNMDGKSRRLKFHMIVDGFPALKVYVDKNQGEDIPQDVPDDMADDMADVVKNMPKKTGKIVTQVKDQLALKVDPSAESTEEIRWVLDEYPMDVDEIAETWSVDIPPEDNISMRQTFDMSLQQDQTKKYKNMAMVFDYWEFPCPKYPKGRRIVVAGDQELEKSDDPGENPFIFFPADYVPGSAIASGLVTDMTTPQKSYNIKRTAEAKVLEEMGNPLWLLPTNSVDDESELSDGIGGFVHFTPVNGFEPKRVQGATVDQGWQNAMERDQADLEDISGAHEISQGAAPRGNNTLGGLQLQVEQDETKIVLLVQSYEDGIKKWGEKVLRLTQKHFPEEQQLSIVGENGEIEAFTFSGADLTGKEVIDVVPGSSMPTLKAVQDDKIMTMYNAGMFNDPKTGVPDARRVVRMLGESIATQYYDDTQQDENKALMEQRLWKQTFSDPKAVEALMQYQAAMQEYQAQAQQMAQQGVDVSQLGLQPPQPPVQLPIVRDFYDHETHIMAHNRYRKTDEYDKLPPPLQMLIDQHVAEHTQYLMAPQMQEQAQQQAVMEQQAQTEQKQTESQTQEADKNREHQAQIKQMELQGKAQSDNLKGNVAIQQAQIRQTK